MYINLGSESEKQRQISNFMVLYINLYFNKHEPWTWTHAFFHKQILRTISQIPDLIVTNSNEIRIISSSRQNYQKCLLNYNHSYLKITIHKINNIDLVFIILTEIQYIKTLIIKVLLTFIKLLVSSILLLRQRAAANLFLSRLIRLRSSSSGLN